MVRAVDKAEAMLALSSAV